MCAGVWGAARSHVLMPVLASYNQVHTGHHCVTLHYVINRHHSLQLYQLVVGKIIHAMTWLMAQVYTDTCNVQVVMMTGGEVQCPISLDTNPLCPQITPCGHVFAFHSIMQHLMTQVRPCPCLLFQWLINQEQGAVCLLCSACVFFFRPFSIASFTTFIEQALGFLFSMSLT